MKDTAPLFRFLPRPRTPSRPTNLALAAGLIAAAGLPPYSGTGFLVPMGLGLFFGVLAGAEKPGRLAWTFGLAHQLVVLHWLFFLVPAKTIPFDALKYVQAVAAIAYVSIFSLGLGWTYGRLRRRLGSRRAFLLLPLLWTLMEALRSRGELGFPWCLSGAAVLGTPLMRLARTAGEPGVGLGLALIAAAGAAWRLGRRPDSPFRGAVGPLAVLTAVAWIGLVGGSYVAPKLPTSTAPAANGENGTPSAARTLSVAAIQANVSLTDKWDDAKIDSTKIPYEKLTKQATDAGAEFVVWAETAVPEYLRYDKFLLNWVRRLVRETGVYLYTGFPDAERQRDGPQRKYNSSGLFAPDGVLFDRYAKHHLLPIGEAMPFTRYVPFLANVDVGQAEWSPGDPPQPQRVGAGEEAFAFSGLICFESAFGELARRSVSRGSRCLVVLTNDGWFGQSAGPRQHAALARLRAVECAVPVIRCANNGISMIVDDRGEVLRSLDLGRRGFVSADLTVGTGRTLYVRYGGWPVFWLLILWLVWVLVAPGPAQRSQGRAE